MLCGSIIPHCCDLLPPPSTHHGKALCGNLVQESLCFLAFDAGGHRLRFEVFVCTAITSTRSQIRNLRVLRRSNPCCSLRYLALNLSFRLSALPFKFTNFNRHRFQLSGVVLSPVNFDGYAWRSCWRLFYGSATRCRSFDPRQVISLNFSLNPVKCFSYYLLLLKHSQCVL
jgi:hypothetical protein